MVARIESEGVGSSTHEKAIMDALNAIDGVQDVIIENGAIHVTYDPLRTTERKIEESIRASGIVGTEEKTEVGCPVRVRLLGRTLRVGSTVGSGFECKFG